MTDKTVTMRYRMTDKDEYYDRLVNGARQYTLMEGVGRRLMAKAYHNVGRCVEIESCRQYIPAYSGHYLEYVARVVKEEGNTVTIEVRCFQINHVPEPRPYPSSVDIWEDPPLAAYGFYKFEYPA